jgi:hypothetical protein
MDGQSCNNIPPFETSSLCSLRIAGFSLSLSISLYRALFIAVTLSWYCSSTGPYGSPKPESINLLADDLLAFKFSLV